MMIGEFFPDGVLQFIHFAAGDARSTTNERTRSSVVINTSQADVLWLVAGLKYGVQRWRVM
jgi:hypothetical protein